MKMKIKARRARLPNHGREIMKTLFASLTLGLFFGSATAHAADPISAAALESRYCTANEKVGFTMKKKVSRPGLTAVKPMDSSAISVDEIKALKSKISANISGATFLSSKVWDFRDEASSISWRIVSYEVNGQGRSPLGVDYLLCRVNAVWEIGAIPTPLLLSTPCAHSAVPREQSIHTATAAPMLEPFDVLEGKSGKRMLFREISGYSSALRLYQPAQDGWKLILSACASSD
jgi:hypothetical protein